MIYVHMHICMYVYIFMYIYVCNVKVSFNPLTTIKNNHDEVSGPCPCHAHPQSAILCGPTKESERVFKTG